MNVGHHLVVPAKFDDAKTKEIHEIFAKVSQSQPVRAAYAVDYCEPQSVKYEDLNKFYAFHTDYWKKLSVGVKVD
jgi:tripartite-type tricarboxylate transporter receptor subunit TctC